MENPGRVIDHPMLFNFRDLGGYTGLGGRTVRWRRLFRSDSLHRLTVADQVAFADLGIRTVIDLRRPHEITRDGRVPEYADLHYHHIHPEHAEWHEAALADGQTHAHWLADRYLELARDGAAGIAAAIDVIAEEQQAPVVVHCVAGKDRTGVVSALTLAVLGVPDDVIAEDYALSTLSSARFTAWRREIEPDGATLPAQFLASPAEAMHLFLPGLRERYGSIEGYLDAAGLPPARVDALREHLLSP